MCKFWGRLGSLALVEQLSLGEGKLWIQTHCQYVTDQSGRVRFSIPQVLYKKNIYLVIMSLKKEKKGF